MYRIKSIDEIYKEAENFDLIITNDAPLATALNGRIGKPHVGGFAYTPRQLATQLSSQILGEPLMSGLEIVAAVAEETGYGFKYVHGEIENIREIRKYTSEVRKYLYSGQSRKVYDSYAALPTLEKAMGGFIPEEYHIKGKAGLVISENIFLNRKTAIVGIELFDDLDKHFIPIKHEEIDIIDWNGEFGMETIYEIGNDRQIAENIVDLIDAERAEDIAIVMDTEGEIADAVRSALYRRGIPFKNTMTVRDLSQVRDYLRFLGFGMQYRTVRVRHIRELFSAYGGHIWAKYDNVLLSRLPDMVGRTLELADCLKNIRNMTFGEVCDLVVQKRHQPQIRILLEELKFTDLKITSKLVGEMTYAVNNVTDLHHNEQIPDDEKKGVLLADCHNSMFVDRSFIALLGMSEDWSKRISGKVYIDRKAEAEKDAMRFRALLQQGSSRVYAVNVTKDGKTAKPTLLFDGINELERKKEAVVSFGDLAEIKKGSWYSEEAEKFPFKESMTIDAAPSDGWKFSKSTYNSFSECPRAFYYGHLIQTPDSEATAFGSLLHEFAEMYICYPEIVNKKGLEYYVEKIGKTYAGLSCPMMEEIDLDRIRIGLENLTTFIDARVPENISLDVNVSSRRYPNGLMIEEGLEMTSGITEVDFSSSVNPINGKMDLVLGNRSIDFKTGRFNTGSDVVKGFDLERALYVEMQPLIYLALMKDKGLSEKGMFTLFHIFGIDGKVMNNDSVDSGAVNVRLMETTKHDSLLLNDSPLRDDFESVAKYKEVYKNWKSFVTPIFASDLPPEEWVANASLNDSIMESMVLKETKGNRGVVEGALKKLLKIYDKDYWSSGNTVYIPKDSMNRFIEKLNEDYRSANIMMDTDFPPMPRKDCKNCSFVSVCTKEPIVVDDGGEEYES